MSRINELREQIDACRAGSDDLQLPQLAALAQAVQQDSTVAGELARSGLFDRHVVSALNDVDAPPGLMARLLEKTATAQSPTAPVEGSVVLTASSANLARRRWLVRAGSLAAIAATALGLAIWLWPPAPRRVLEAELASHVQNWMAQTDSPDGWKSTPPPALALPKLHHKPTGWRQFHTAAGEHAAAFKLPSSSGVRVRLFVVSTRNTYVVPAAPGSLLPGTTGDVKVYAWQSAGGMLYVLFIDRGGPPLDAYLQIVPIA